MRGKLLGRVPTRRILVTGAPRSATTFVGKVLSWPLGVDYLHEPFNPLCGLPSVELLQIDIAGSPADLRSRITIELDALLRYEPMLRTGYYERDPLMHRLAKRVFGGRGPFNLRLARMNPFSSAVVVKDPFAVMAIDALVDRWNFEPVCLVRHPFAFVAAVQRVGWQPTRSLRDLASQPHVIARMQEEDRAALTEGFPSNEMRAGALLWRILTRELVNASERHSEAVLLTHEQLSADPVVTFRDLYGRFALPWTSRIERRVVTMTGGSNPAEATRNRTQGFSRDSGSLLQHRLSSLEPEVRESLWTIVADVATRWYTPSGLRSQA